MNIIIHWLLLSIHLISSSLFYANFLPPTTTHNTLSAILRCYDPIMHKSQGIKANMINVAEYLLWMGWHPYIKDSVMMHFFYISAWRFMPLNSVSDCSCLMYRNHIVPHNSLYTYEKVLKNCSSETEKFMITFSFIKR